MSDEATTGTTTNPQETGSPGRSTQRSRELFRRAEAALAGGTSSPVRAFRSVGGTPRVLRRASGARTWDADGNEYLDFVGSWGPLILGHAHPAIVAAVSAAAADGTTFGAPCEREIALAEKVCALVPAVERVRFTSSGTEATMSAIRLARGFTGRELIVKFAGCYHGHADHLLVAAGSGLATFGTPSSAGVPRAFAERTLVLPLDDEAALRELFAARGDDVACVILEPVPANNGLLIQRERFLAAVREVTEQHGALLILDEVITGFRLGPGGACARYGVTPDLATFGKVIGGGLPVGAFGGRRDVMERLAPQGDVYQAGTLSGNPVAMAAGLATLDTLEREDGWARLEALGDRLEGRLGGVLSRAGYDLARIGSIFWMSLQSGPAPRSTAEIEAGAADRYAPLFHGLLDRGISLAPSAFEVGFLSLAHTEADVDRLADAVAELL